MSLVDCKKIMILAPHQDDEIILCGAFLKELTEKYDVYIVFMTNGDYEKGIGEVRLKEALSVARLYGLPEDKVIFMGYANEYDVKGSHIYNANENEVVYSQYGTSETFGLSNHPEYRFQKSGIHHAYKRENLLKDLYDIINEILPDIIFATDVEIHPDHKANSLFLDEVLGRILREQINYCPIVLKKPEYLTSWFGMNDYTIINNKASKFVRKAVVNNEAAYFSNPYLRWRDRIRIPIGASARSFKKKNNILYKALGLYKSQNAIQQFERMMDSDVSFFARRTDSLTYHANVTVSSGNREFLQDFKLVDSNDISRKKLDYWNIGASVWSPDATDKYPTIKYEFAEEKKINEVVIYQGFCPKSEILRSKLVFSDGYTIEINKLEKRKATRISVPQIETLTVTYIIEDCSNLNGLPEISQIEIYEEKTKQWYYIKTMINDNFVYEYVMDKIGHHRIQIYGVDESLCSRLIDFNLFEIKIMDIHGNILNKENFFDRRGYIISKPKDAIRVKLVLCSDKNIKDDICIFGNKKCLVEYLKLTDMLKGCGISAVEIKDFYFSSSMQRIQIIKRFYRLALLSGKSNAKRYLKSSYIKAVMELKKDNALSLQDTKEFICFEMYGDCMPASFFYRKNYLLGKKNIVKYKTKAKRIFLIGTPDHHNMGDHIIAHATYIFLQKCFPEKEVIEIAMNNFDRMFQSIKLQINPDDIIILQGGGNMGNIYWRNERIRRIVIKNFTKNKIVIFPETIYYEDNVYGHAEMIESQRIYNSADNLTICAREKKSYDIMNELYYNCKILLVPDIVCSLKINFNDKRKNALIMARGDSEKILEKQDIGYIEEILKDKYDTFMYSDMMRAGGYIGKGNRSVAINEKIKLIANSQLVVTDRLHAMIVSFITKTPCLVICGYNHKIKSSYDTWFKEIPYIKLLDVRDINYSKEQIKSLIYDLAVYREDGIDFQKNILDEFDILKKLLMEDK